MEEIWKDIPGYEGKYQVSSMGNVKSLSRTIHSSNQYGEFEFQIKERVLRPGEHSREGHLSVVLNDPRKSRRTASRNGSLSQQWEPSG